MKFKFLFLFFLIIPTSIFSQYAKMEESMEKPLKYYVTVAKEGQLIPGRKMIKSQNPKISLVIPMYNEQKNILTVIRSIENQSLQDIEIVCVNDNSNDDTLSILKNLQKDDPRITIITNKSNRGVIYNRIYGALKSKGEYVTFIDADDALCNINILEKAYNIATKEYNEKIDIVHYQTCGSEINSNGEFGPFLLITTFNPNNFNKVIRKPEIGDNYFQKNKNITGSGFVFDKIYSRSLIKRAADYIGADVWNQNLIFVDDFLLAFAVMKMADSIVNIGEIGYYHLFDTATSTTSNVWKIKGDKLVNPAKSNKKIGDYMIILERMLQLTDNEPQSVEFREFALRKLGEDIYLKAIARSIHFDKYLYLCEKFIKWKYVTKEAKERTLSFMKHILSYKIDIENKYDYIVNEGKSNNRNINDEDDDIDDSNSIINEGVADL